MNQTKKSPFLRKKIVPGETIPLERVSANRNCLETQRIPRADERDSCHPVPRRKASNKLKSSENDPKKLRPKKKKADKMQRVEEEADFGRRTKRFGEERSRSKERKSCEQRRSDWHQTKERSSGKKKKQECRIKTDISLERLEQYDKYKTKQLKETVLKKGPILPCFSIEETSFRQLPEKQVKSLTIDKELQTSDSLLVPRGELSLQQQIERIREEERRRWEALIKILSGSKSIDCGEMLKALGMMVTPATGAVPAKPQQRKDRSSASFHELSCNTFQNIEDICQQVNQLNSSSKKFLGVDLVEQRIRRSRRSEAPPAAHTLEQDLDASVKEDLSGLVVDDELKSSKSSISDSRVKKKMDILLDQIISSSQELRAKEEQPRQKQAEQTAEQFFKAKEQSSGSKNTYKLRDFINHKTVQSPEPPAQLLSEVPAQTEQVVQKGKQKLTESEPHQQNKLKLKDAQKLQDKIVLETIPQQKAEQTKHEAVEVDQTGLMGRQEDEKVSLELRLDPQVEAEGLPQLPLQIKEAGPELEDFLNIREAYKEKLCNCQADSIQLFIDELIGFISNNYAEETDSVIRQPLGYSLREFFRELRLNERSPSYGEEGADSKFIIGTHVFINLSKSLMARGSAIYRGINEGNLLFQHCFNQVLYDSMNEVLDWYRPYSIGGRPIFRPMVSQSSSAIDRGCYFKLARADLLAFNSIRAGRIIDGQQRFTEDEHRRIQNDIIEGLQRLLKNEIEWDCFRWGKRDEALAEQLLLTSERVAQMLLQQEVQQLCRLASGQGR